MPRYKKTASRLKDPSRFQSSHIEEKYDEFYKELGFRTIYEKELLILDVN